MVDDLLDLAKIEAGRTVLQTEVVVLADMLQEVMDMVSMKADQNHVQLLLEADGLPPGVCVDGTKLRQVLINLMANALDAMAEQPTGGNAPRVRKLRLSTAPFEDESRSPNGRIWVRVCDSGAGMEPEQMARLFEPFFTTKPQGSGLGLGLTLSASLAGAAGGTLQAQPQAHGAAFVLCLPLCPQQENHHV